MSRKTLASLTVAAALASTATSAIPAQARPVVDPPLTNAGAPPTQVTVTRPAGFAWAEALLGAGVGGALVVVATSAGGLRRRVNVPRISGSNG